MDIAQPPEEVGVRQAGADVEFQPNGADHLDVVGQRWCGVDEDVGPGFEFAVVHGFGRGRKSWTTDRRGGVGRIVPETVGG